MTGWQQDARYAVRVLRRSPGFTAIAIALIALGIGATTAIFTIVNSVLLRPLPLGEPGRLAMLQLDSGSRFSEGYLDAWRRQARTLHDIAGWYDVRSNLTGRGEPIEVRVDRVTANFFAVLGTPPLIGRTFAVHSTLSQVDPEVVLSYGFWQRRFGGDERIVGQSITLDGESLTVVGVMPQTLKIRTNELAESRAELWMPFRLKPDELVGIGGFLNVVARLAPGVSFAQAQADLAVIAQRIEAQHPSYSRNWRVAVTPLLDATVQYVRPTLLLLFAAVGILQLIVCANVATLMLSRAASRRTEVGIRVSLGASPARLVRQLLTESVVLGAAGGALGVPLATLATQFFAGNVPAGLDLPRTGEISVDLRMLAFASLITGLTVLFCGLLPSINLLRVAPQSQLRHASRTTSSSGGPLTGMLIVCEVALALVLLASAGLLVRSFLELTRVKTGFQAQQVLTMRTTLPAARYDSPDRILAFGRELLDRVTHVPGVQAAGFANYLPLSNTGEGAAFEIEGRPVSRPDERLGSWESIVFGQYFEAMGIPLLRGRLPGPADTEHTQLVLVIDEEAATRYFRNEDPIGRRLVFEFDRTRVTGEIIGVVGAVRWGALAARPNPTTYFWFPQRPRPDIAIAARIAGEPTAMVDAIAAQVRAIDPSQPVADVRPMRDYVSDELARPRLTAVILGGFAGSALLLTALGLYGVIAFAVTQRTREIGIRVALGARYHDVLRLLMTRGLLLIASGVAIGAAAALVEGRLVARFLYGVRPGDPPTLVTSAVLLTSIGILAVYLPARRATRVDPMVALKSE